MQSISSRTTYTKWTKYLKTLYPYYSRHHQFAALCKTSFSTSSSSTWNVHYYLFVIVEVVDSSVCNSHHDMIRTGLDISWLIHLFRAWVTSCHSTRADLVAALVSTWTAVNYASNELTILLFNTSFFRSGSVWAWIGRTVRLPFNWMFIPCHTALSVLLKVRRAVVMSCLFHWVSSFTQGVATFAARWSTLAFTLRIEAATSVNALRKLPAHVMWVVAF